MATTPATRTTRTKRETERCVPPPGLGTALRTAREAADMSQAELAERLGVWPSYVSKLELGQRCPSRTVAVALQAVLPLTETTAALLGSASVDSGGRSGPSSLALALRPAPARPELEGPAPAAP